MVDRINIISFGVILIVAFLLTISSAKPCDMKADVCQYNWVVDYHLTMMKGRQLLKLVNGKLYPFQVQNTTGVPPIPEDDILTLDGYHESRMVIGINGKVPGPLIEAYIGQTVLINVENRLFSDTVTIHWHGMRQEGTQFMDGVPFITQCPIGPSQSFQYKFKLTQTGSFWYHSHSGTQRTNGLYGGMIIRGREVSTIQEHTMVVTDFNHRWDSNAIFTKLTHGMFNMFNFHSCLVNGRGRYYSAPGVHNNAPLASFTVKQGKQYRFRVINAASFYPFEVAVDGHRMSVVATDGEEVQPFIADVVIVNPGERFDFIITANRTVGNYMIRGIMPDPRMGDKFEAILHYEKADNTEPKSLPKNCTARPTDPCLVLNCGNGPYPPGRKCTQLIELSTAFNYNVPPATPGKFKEYFLNFAFPGIPGQGKSSINGRQFRSPTVNAMYQANEIDTRCENQNCGVDRLCRCTYMIQADKDDTVQLNFVNMGQGKAFDHPIHLHGQSFSVLKMGAPTVAPGFPPKVMDNSDIDCRGDPKINFCNDAAWRNTNWGGDNIPGLKLRNAPLKDTMIVPVGSYVIVRFKADNPGLWFMHCHTELHNVDGMRVVLNVSWPNIPKPPPNFPECRSFTPQANSMVPKRMDPESGSEAPSRSQPPPFAGAMTGMMMTWSLVGVICVLAVILIFLTIVVVWRTPRKTTYTISGGTTNPALETENTP